MATNYMTILESEILDLEPRLWRLRQAVEVPDPRFDHDEVLDLVMKMRYEATLKLYKVLRLQHHVWSYGETDFMKGRTEEGLLELVSDTEPDIESMPRAYRYEMDDLDVDNCYIDHKWMSITRPEDSLSKDMSDELREKIRKDSSDFLKKTMSKDAFDEMERKSEDERKLGYYGRMERNLRMCGVYSDDEIKDIMDSERKYYEDLERFDKELGGKTEDA